MVADGADEIRKLVRTLCREGVDTVKLNISGNHTLRAGRASRTLMTDKEVATAAQTAHSFGKRVAVHARSSAAVQLALKHGVEIIYHCEFADEAALDALEAAKDRIFLAPAAGMMHDTIHRGAAFGITQERIKSMGLNEQFDALCGVYTELRKRGLKVLIGGDYGFPWSPHGENARDLEHFVRLFGYTHEEALECGTRVGAEAMLLGDRAGQVREGFFADLLLVRGRPFEDVRLLQDADNLLAILKGGTLHKSPSEHAERGALRSAAAA